jgi:hypothetical protein
MRRRGWCGCWWDSLGKEWPSLAWLSKDLFVDATKGRQLSGFWVKRSWIRDVSNFAYTKRKCVGDFFREWGGFGFRGVYWLVSDVWWVSGIVGRPNANANAFLVCCGDFKFRVGYESVKGLVPPDKKPGVVDEFEG